MIEGRHSGDSWRWSPRYHRSPSRSTIAVIEPAKEREIPEGAEVVPFGFARALHDPPVDPDFADACRRSGNI